MNNYTNLRNFSLILLCTFFIIGLCLLKISPSLNADDSPETITAQLTLGVQHPPGYPLNSLIGKLFNFIPLGSYALRGNLMSMFFHILTSLFVFFFVVKHLSIFEKNNLFFAISASILYMFCSSPFLQISSVKGSIYTMNAFFTIVILFNIFSFEKNIKFFYLASFLYGLSWTNHWQSMSIIFPAIIIWLFKIRKNMNLQICIRGLLFFVIGLSAYIYILIRSSDWNAYTWGGAYNVYALIKLITLENYRPDIIHHGPGFSSILWIYFFKNLLFDQFGFFTIFFVVPGYFILNKRRKLKSFILLCSFLLLVIGIVTMTAGNVFNQTEWVMKPFLTSSYIFISIFIASGISYILEKLFIRIKKHTLYIKIVIIFMILFLSYFSKQDYSRYFLVYDYIKNIDLSIPSKSIYFAEGEMDVFGSNYLKYINKKDFFPISTYSLVFDWYRNKIRYMYKDVLQIPSENFRGIEYLKYLMELNKKLNILYSGQYNAAWQSFPLSPYGIINKVEFSSTQESYPQILNAYSYRGVYDKTLECDEFGSYMVVKPYGIRIRRFGDMFFKKGDFSSALTYYKKSSIFFKDSYISNAIKITNINLQKY